MTRRVLALTSSASTVAAKQDRILFLFKANGIDVQIVDAASERDKRIELIATSGRGPVYPQLFIEETNDGDGPSRVDITFLGGYDDIVAMNEDGLITKEALGLEVAREQPDDEPEHKMPQEVEREIGNDPDAPWSTQPEENVLCWGILPDWLVNMFKKPPAVLQNSSHQGTLTMA